MAVSIAMTVAGCSGNDEDRVSPYKKIEMSDETRAVVSNANDFALDLFTKVESGADGKNVVVSPLSVMTTLSMLANGDNGDSRDAILGLLGFADKSEGLDRLNEYCKVILRNLPVVDSSTKCKLANSVWSGQNALVPDFASVMTEIYNSEYKSVSPSGAEGQKAINSWIEDKTSGLIRDFIKQPLMYDFAVVNATYFKGIWKERFDKGNTKSERFSNIDGSESEVDMMHLSDKKFACSVDDDAIALSMPYGNGNFEMVSILPVREDGFDDLIENLNERYVGMINNRRYYSVDLSFPKFTSSSDFDVLGYFKEAGLHSGSQFNAIYSNPLTLCSILTGVTVSVDESGTEAAAVTMPGMVTGIDDELKLEFNRPFIYLIRETSTGTILFMGKETKL